MLAVIALVAGSAIYMCHRAFIYPIIFCFGHFCVFGHFDINQTDLRRWNNIRNNGFAKDMRQWASEVHALYCAGWALALALVCGKCLCLGEEHMCLVAYAAKILIVFGFVHHGRYLVMLQDILEIDRHV